MSAAFETLRKSNFSSAQQMILRGLEISQSADKRVNFIHEFQIFQDFHDFDILQNHHDLQKIEDPPDLLGVPDLCDLQYPQDPQLLCDPPNFQGFSRQNLDIQDAEPSPLIYDLVLKKN